MRELWVVLGHNITVQYFEVWQSLAICHGQTVRNAAKAAKY